MASDWIPTQSDIYQLTSLRIRQRFAEQLSRSRERYVRHGRPFKTLKDAAKNACHGGSRKEAKEACYRWMIEMDDVLKWNTSKAWARGIRPLMDRSYYEQGT